MTDILKQYDMKTTLNVLKQLSSKAVELNIRLTWHLTPLHSNEAEIRYQLT